MERALGYLVAVQGRDGGWGYQRAGDSFTEPTALGLIATVESEADSAAVGAASWLLQTQRRDGGWGAIRNDTESGWQTAVAVWALSAARTAGLRADLDAPIGRAVEWLVSNRSRSIELPNPATRLQGHLSGWSWTPGTFGWVIPTGLALIALKACAAPIDGTVTTEAASLLNDRRCRDGGWNWGNPVLFGSYLPPYATETAIAVLGLLAAGEAVASPEVSGGVAWLGSNLDPATGVAATAWGLIALRAAGRDGAGSGAAARLRAAQGSDGGWRASPHATALAVLALNPALPMPLAPA